MLAFDRLALCVHTCVVGAPTESVTFRFPPGLRERIAGTARSNRRSLNAEVVLRLEESLGTPVRAWVTSDVSSGREVVSEPFEESP